MNNEFMRSSLLPDGQTITSCRCVRLIGSCTQPALQPGETDKNYHSEDEVDQTRFFSHWVLGEVYGVPWSARILKFGGRKTGWRAMQLRMTASGA